jgi:hypothetical protein
MGYVCDVNHSTFETTSQHKQKYYVCNAGSLQSKIINKKQSGLTEEMEWYLTIWIQN